MSSCFPFTIGFPFNGPTCWIFYANCFCSRSRIFCSCLSLATHSFVFGHRSWISCLCLSWVSYDVIKKNYIDEGFLKLCGFKITPSRSLRNRLRYLLAEIASRTKQLPKRTIARILESISTTSFLQWQKYFVKSILKCHDLSYLSLCFYEV